MADRRNPQTIDPGELDTLIGIEEEISTDTPYGGQTKQWTQVAQQYARVRAIQNTERWREGAERTAAIYLLTMYRNAGLTERNRIKWGGLVFNVREVRLPPGTSQFMDVIVESGVRT